MVLVEAPTLGDGWLAVSRAILERGEEATWGGSPTLELALVTLTVDRPDPLDPLIAELGDAGWLGWMHRNFFVHEEVPELGRARSYAQRLFEYGGAGRDQIAWVVERLRADPECRDATITTFEPLADTTYIPCVSMLDFWLRDDAVELVVYAHSLDFGKKGTTSLARLSYVFPTPEGRTLRKGTACTRSSRHISNSSPRGTARTRRFATTGLASRSSRRGSTSKASTRPI